MSSSFCICEALFGASIDTLWAPLLVATLVQYFWGFIWYHVITHVPYMRSIAVDKGVKQVTSIKMRYSMNYAMALSLIAALFRAAAIISVIHHVGPKVLASSCKFCVYSQVGFAVTLVQASLMGEDAIYAQRPFSLIVINGLYILGCSLLASTTLAFM